MSLIAELRRRNVLRVRAARKPCAKERDILQRLLRDQIPFARLNGIGEDDLERNLGQLRNTPASSWPPGRSIPECLVIANARKRSRALCRA